MEGGIGGTAFSFRGVGVCFIPLLYSRGGVNMV